MSKETPLAQLSDIDDVAPLSNVDKPCLDEIRAVLAKHDALQRFGITLLHEHFEVAEDEILVETIDAKTRTLTSRPEKVSELSNYNAVETSWRLDDLTAMASCRKVCRPASFTERRHSQAHFS